MNIDLIGEPIDRTPKFDATADICPKCRFPVERCDCQEEVELVSGRGFAASVLLGIGTCIGLLIGMAIGFAIGRSV